MMEVKKSLTITLNPNDYVLEWGDIEWKDNNDDFSLEVKRRTIEEIIKEKGSLPFQCLASCVNEKYGEDSDEYNALWEIALADDGYGYATRIHIRIEDDSE